MLACLCTVLWQLPAVPALNRTGDPGPGPSIQKTYDLTRYLEHQLRSLAGTYVSIWGCSGAGSRVENGGEGRENTKRVGVLVNDRVMGRGLGSQESSWLAHLLPSLLGKVPPPPHPWPQV